MSSHMRRQDQLLQAAVLPMEEQEVDRLTILTLLVVNILLLSFFF